MRKLSNQGKHAIGIFSILFFLFALLGSSSSRHIGTVSFDVKEDDLFSKASLNEMIQSKKELSVMVRNIHIGDIRTITGGDPSSTLINALERTLT